MSKYKVQIRRKGTIHWLDRSKYDPTTLSPKSYSKPEAEAVVKRLMYEIKVFNENMVRLRQERLDSNHQLNPDNVPLTQCEYEIRCVPTEKSIHEQRKGGTF